MTDQNTPHLQPNGEYPQILEKVTKARDELDEIIKYLNSLEEQDAIANRIIHTSLIEVKIECDYCCQMIFDYPNNPI